MPARLRPSAPIAADAILVGDPGRALLLAQALLEQPKMSNHARGLWGYTGRTPAGRELSLQATGMGGPSAALVLTDLAELGVRRAIRIGTCTALAAGLEAGQLLTVERAHAWAGPDDGPGPALAPDPELSARVRKELGKAAQAATAVSLDALHIYGADPTPPVGDVADMQTAALLARASQLGIAMAAVLIVSEARGERLDDEASEAAAIAAGAAAAASI